MNGYRITTKQQEFDFELIHQFLRESYWSPGIPLSTLKKGIENSLSFAIMDAHQAQVGFARVITDKATFAYVADVFIVESLRGEGLSKWLLSTP